MFNFDRYCELANEYINNHNDKTILNKLRLYLDSCGFKLPEPKFIYNEEDIATHKFLDSDVIYKNGKIVGTKNILNPDFKYH